MKRKNKQEQREQDISVLRDCIMTVAVLTATTLICWNLRETAYREVHITLLYVLATLMISRFTERFQFGLAASLISILEIDYFFMAPYFQIDFSISGYPFTFFVIFSVSIVVSMLMHEVRLQKKHQIEADREKMRANLLRAVSHDIRSPLTSVIGSVSTVIDNYQKMETKESIALLKDARAEAQWLIRVVENLLLVTRMDGVRATLKKTEEPVEEVLSSALVKLRKRFPEAAIKVKISEELFFVPMDVILIEQVICNLVENALIHGKTVSQIEITVDAEGEEAIFCIEDDGEGIAPEVQKKLFKESMYREKGESANEKRNMGIGLSVCKSIIEAHGGSLHVGNRPQGGARVSFSLPLEDVKRTE